MVYDCFTFRDELDLLEFRLKVLDKVVDKFIICEANKTFTNIDKPYYFEKNQSRFKQWEDKIVYLPIILSDDGLDFSTKDTSYNPNSAAWQFEYQQRSALFYGLENVKDSDIILMGDIDEIPNPDYIKSSQVPSTCVMDFYYYYVNNKSIGPRDKQWLGTSIINGQLLSQLENLQQLRDIRSSLPLVKTGWHFSYLGGKEIIRTKIQSISHTEYNKEKFYCDENIEQSLKTGKDIFNRPEMNFSIVPLESEFPEYFISLLKNYPNFIY
jgi:beta-1,4-mannosyl-glycoprotein beta-1,4-N-acetylglucosaminyltransferase